MSAPRRQIYRPPNGEILTKELLEDKLALMLRNKRIFYILSINATPGVLKFGVAHASRDNPNVAVNRLKSYLIAYGAPDNNNRCAGVWLHYLEYTNYVPNKIYYTAARVYKIERNVIRVLKSKLDGDRGHERTLPNQVTVQDIVDVADRTVEGDDPAPAQRYRLRRTTKTQRRRSARVLRPNDIVRTKASRFSAKWAKEAFGDEWKTATVRGVVTSVNGSDIMVRWDGDDKALRSTRSHLTKVRS